MQRTHIALWFLGKKFTELSIAFKGLKMLEWNVNGIYVKVNFDLLSNFL